MINLHYHEEKSESAAAAANFGARAIKRAIDERGCANVVVATGASQLEMLEALVTHNEVSWRHVTGFHLDEYVGLPPTNRASFRRYLRERFTERLPALGGFHFIEGDASDCDAEIARMNQVLDQHPIDVTLAGIGENGHLAFNDPPADFISTAAFKKVTLDPICRLQQVGEGWFATLDEVPLEAISMTIQRIMTSRTVVLTVPDARKAAAVREVLQGPVTNIWPASILQQHGSCHLFLDRAAASKLTGTPDQARVPVTNQGCV